MALERIRRELRVIRHDAPGRRFEATHERHRIRNHAVRLTVIGVGGMLMFAAALTFWVPGPNFVLVLVGLALVAGQWRMAARLLDRGEVALRRWHDETWEPMPRWRRSAIIAFTWILFASVVLALLVGAGRAKLLPGWLPIVG